MFKWTCLALAVVFGIALLVMIADLKHDVTASIANANDAVVTVNQRLPEMISEVKTGTETLAGLADDVELIKSLAGISAEQSDRGVRGLANYADEIQKILARKIGGKGVEVMKERVIGKKLEVFETADEFLVGLSKEMVTLVLFAKSKEEILDRACHSRRPRRTPFFLKFSNEEPILMEEFIRQHHPESAELPAMTK
jgi:hypothetical protein